tara:strand:+ start:367 stop:519 length:153 start_codon:yes stop_codon:yes gene_type:complete
VLEELLLAVVDNGNGYKETKRNSKIGKENKRKMCAPRGGNAAVSGNWRLH